MYIVTGLGVCESCASRSTDIYIRITSFYFNIGLSHSDAYVDLIAKKNCVEMDIRSAPHQGDVRKEIKYGEMEQAFSNI